LIGGTLTLPVGPGPFPAVLLISGSGQQDRDEAIAGHRPFLVLADRLTRLGIAVLRTDDRGVGKTGGDPRTATTEDFAADAAAAISYLRTRPDIDSARIGLIGHSEGGIIAPLVAVRTGRVALLVLLAGPAVTGEELLLAQSEALARASGVPETQITENRRLNETIYRLVKSESDTAVLIRRARAVLREAIEKMSPGEQESLGDPEVMIESSLRPIVFPWFRWFLTHDPRPSLATVRCPMLALFGEKDLQVPPKQNLSALEEAVRLSGNPDVVAKVIPGVNHLFQTAGTGLPAEYATIEETISPAVLDTIGDWVVRTTRH
jgi:pimeloyl-ACP methyl ester carboxylesterase